MSMLNYCAKKNSISVGIIYVISKNVSLLSLFSIYYTLIYPYCICCSLAWGQTYATHFKPFIILQKRVLHIINKLPNSSHTNNLLFSNSILKLEYIQKYGQAIDMYCNINNQYVRSHHYSPQVIGPICFQHSRDCHPLNNLYNFPLPRYGCDGKGKLSGYKFLNSRFYKGNFT